jgi:hypothetical protein
VDDDEMVVSYQGVTPGVPVLTRDGAQFGILEHVLEVPQLDVFDGIVVWVGSPAVVQQRLQRQLGEGDTGAANRTERAAGLQHLRFVDADRIAAITVGYIRCDLDAAGVAALTPPDGAPVYHADPGDAGSLPGLWPGGLHRWYGGMFRRPHWTRERD